MSDFVADQQSIQTVNEAFDSLREELHKANGIINQKQTELKAPIYRKYAAIIAQFIEKSMVQDTLIYHFMKDRKIIRYALRDNPEYRLLTKGAENEPDKELEKSSRQLDQFGKMISRELENNNTETNEEVSIHKREIERLKKVIEELQAPQVVRIEKKFLTKIREQDHTFLLIKDNWIWQSWDHNPTEKEIKNCTEVVGF